MGLLGAVGAFAMTVATSVEPVAAAVLAPFLGGYAMQCDLVVPREKVLEMSLTFFRLSVWSWPFEFATMAFRGFALGMGDFMMSAVVGTISTWLHIWGIFVVFVANPSLKVLGLIRLGLAILTAALWFMNLLLRPSMR